MLGPTAAGKSRLAVMIALRYGGEVVSADSMQVYRGMDIGTAKPTQAERRGVPHHLLDLVGPEKDFSAADYQRAGRPVLRQLAERKVSPVICGGSGLHFRSLVDPLEFPPHDESVRAELEELDADVARAMLYEADPTAGRHVDLANPRRVVRALEIARLTGLTPSQRARSADAAAVKEYRPVVDFVAIGLDPGDELAARVAARFDAMLARGLVDEVARLQSRLGRLAAQAVGYKQLLPVVTGDDDLGSARAAAIQATMGLAKRQRTFFRRDPRIHWITWNPDPTELYRAATEYLDGIAAWSS